MKKPIRSFGPVVHHEEGGLRASCTYCAFRINVTCTHKNPSRTIDDPSNTPDWCEMKDSMVSDAIAAIQSDAIEG